ncbi:metal-dependent hydrolase [Pseudoduganella namucuonensis]|uniref:Inner membrane protein n=1 Tax=Pseudoduganella namucuonensis TaxID=1035707 RepID=A0A1I7FUP1_9BURK|nr:metal-dependent hydrolase [Pseudoduganella namucuonensis]SFU39891.1 inner membrane protein [Pseudoduganella namucuonensis]
MDNITHTVIGLGVGELVQRSLAPEPDEAGQRTRHRLLLTACALASNFPDLDLFLTGLLPEPLGYLLHHRGHTHTLLYALPQALLLLALLWLLWPNARALLQRSGRARAGLAASVALGFALHLGMDFLNSYGVHPFYPFDGRWFYGDMVFIIEPVFWVAFGVPLIMAVPWRPARWLLMACLAGALGYFLHKQFLSPVSFGALLALGLGLAALRRFWAHSRWAMALALAASAAFVAGQGAASAAGAQRVRAALAPIDPRARLLDVAMTAFPAQPLCWIFVSVESDEAADRYRLRRGLVSLAPDVVPPSRCPAGLADPGRPAAAGAGVLLYREVEGSLSGLRRLRRENCWIDDWLRFGRAPALEGGAITDLRFATTPRGNFSTMDLAGTGGRACPAGVPAWTHPRADLLAPPPAAERQARR